LYARVVDHRSLYLKQPRVSTLPVKLLLAPSREWNRQEKGEECSRFRLRGERLLRERERERESEKRRNGEGRHSHFFIRNFPYFYPAHVCGLQRIFRKDKLSFIPILRSFLPSSFTSANASTALAALKKWLFQPSNSFLSRKSKLLKLL
jgi:hypothetical protein